MENIPFINGVMSTLHWEEKIHSPLSVFRNEGLRKGGTEPL